MPSTQIHPGASAAVVARQRALLRHIGDVARLLQRRRTGLRRSRRTACRASAPPSGEQEKDGEPPLRLRRRSSGGTRFGKSRATAHKIAAPRRAKIASTLSRSTGV
ncbi:MAG: hypothetical protein R3F11_15140 [Verrucomicrobiales bacterium]